MFEICVPALPAGLGGRFLFSKMHKIELTSGQLEYLQELVMFGYEMEVPEQKGWDVQTYDNLVDAVMQ